MKSKFTPQLELLLSVMILLTLISCKKEKTQQPPPATHPEMEYFDLNSREIKANSTVFNIDLNHDGREDLAFATALVGDLINHVDKLQFSISSNIDINLPVNEIEEIPVMNNGESIPLENFNGYHWFELSSIVLIQKIISFTQPPVWEGHWKNAVHKYLPFQVIENDKHYNGWVELSVDIAGEKIILHKAALSKEPNKIINAGE